MVIILDCWHFKKKWLCSPFVCNLCMGLLDKNLQWSLVGYGLGFGSGISVEIEYHGFPKL
jgi:hypothetical protein